MGFNTIDLALFIPADLAIQARNWFKKNYDMTVTGRPLIRENDADDHAPRCYGVELQATPEMHTTLKRLLAKPAHSTLRMRATTRGARKLRRALKAELASRGWRIKPGA